MVDEPLSALTEVTDVNDEDLLYVVIDPSGSPLSRGINRANVIARIKTKEPVRAATTTAGTLASDFEDGDTIDGVALATGDRILIKNQAAGEENGIYIVAASGAPTRASDFDTDAKIRGAVIIVNEGTANANRLIKNTNTSAIVVDTTALTFQQLNGLGIVTAGTGLVKSGDTMNLDIDELDAKTTPTDANDTVVIKDTDASNTPKEITIDNLMKGKYIVSVPVGGFFKRTTGGTSEDLTQEEMPTNKVNFKKFSFDKDTDEFIQILVPMPDTWDGGTVEVQFIWKANATSGTARWAAAGRSYGNGETLDQAMGSTQEVDDAVTATANQLLISDWTSAIILAGTPAAGEVVIMEISRNANHANDDLNADAALLGIRVRVGVNKKADG